ncbi:unnamed protein product, partial [marine sediment metagenome]
ISFFVKWITLRPEEKETPLCKRKRGVKHVCGIKETLHHFQF